MQSNNHFLPLLFLFILTAVLVSACGAAPPPPAAVNNLTPIEQRGFNLFMTHCASCHALTPGTVIVGPSLDGIASRAGDRVEGQNAEEYIQTSILDPTRYLVEGFPDSMPPDLGKRLRGEEFDAIVAFLLTLK